MNAIERLKRYSEIATRGGRGVAEVDYVTLRDTLVELDRLQSAFARITEIPGCECDDGYTCGLCKARRIARDAVRKAREE